MRKRLKPVKGRNWIFDSFAGKLIFFIFLLMTVAFIFRLFYDYESVSEKILLRETDRFVTRLDNARCVIRDSLNNTELSIAATKDRILRHIDEPEVLSQVPVSLLTFCPGTYGSAVALEEGILKGHDGFMAYSHRGTAREIVSERFDNSDYTHTDWYARPKNLGKALWSDPYFDEGISERYLCTYSCPIYLPDHTFAGVYTADITLHDYERFIDELSPYDDPRCYAELIGAGGDYIASKNVSDTSLVLIGETGKYENKALDFILANDTGSQQTVIDGEKCLVVHCLVSDDIGWKLIMVCPMAVIMNDLNRETGLSILGDFSFMAVLLLIIFLSVRTILNPISVVSESAQGIAGDIRKPLPEIGGVNEIRRLCASLETMRTEICRYVDEVSRISAENERIENELEIARKIQNSMLPDPHPDFVGNAGFSLSAFIRPAREVGGDMYDYLIKDGKLHFIIGDASGKGVPASMFMAATIQLYRAFAGEGRTACETVTKLNNAICVNNSMSMFETMVIGVVNLNTGFIELCNAGHTAPLVLCSQRQDYLSLESNVPVGVLENFTYRSNQFKMNEGDTLLFYTDGVTEAEDCGGGQFGEDRLLQVAVDSREKPLEALLDDIVSSIGGFTLSREQSDDITILALRYEKCLWSKELSCVGVLADLPCVTALIEEASDGFKIPSEVSNRITLSVEEAVVNVINYSGPFTFCLKVFKDAFVVILKDSGKPFNPLEAPLPDTGLSAEEREIGGLGILLLRQLSDRAHYERRDGMNILSMKYNICVKI